MIIFIAGGAMFSEIRVGYEVTKATGVEVIVGSSAMFAPDKILEDLGAEKKKKAASSSSGGGADGGGGKGKGKKKGGGSEEEEETSSESD